MTKLSLETRLKKAEKLLNLINKATKNNPRWCDCVSCQNQRDMISEIPDQIDLFFNNQW